MISTDLVDDHYCFACGMDNPGGLRMEWKITGRTTESTFVPARIHQGWRGVVHGGILASVLDEAMTRLAWKTHGNAVTGEMTVRFVKPAIVGDTLTVRGEIGEIEGRKIPARAEVRNSKGEIVASATGKAIKIRETAKQK